MPFLIIYFIDVLHAYIAYTTNSTFNVGNHQKMIFFVFYNQKISVFWRLRIFRFPEFLLRLRILRMAKKFFCDKGKRQKSSSGQNFVSRLGFIEKYLRLRSLKKMRSRPWMQPLCSFAVPTSAPIFGWHTKPSCHEYIGPKNWGCKIVGDNLGWDALI